MIKLVDLLKEITTPELNDKEQQVVDDILSEVGNLEEAVNFQNVMNKIKVYARKGLITAAVLASLMGNDAFSQPQKDQIKDIVKTEQPTQNNVISFKDFKELIEKENFETIPGSIPVNMIKGVENVKIYRAVGQTQAAAMQSAVRQAKNPIKSFKFSRKVGNNIEILIAVPA